MKIPTPTTKHVTFYKANEIPVPLFPDSGLMINQRDDTAYTQLLAISDHISTVSRNLNFPSKQDSNGISLKIQRVMWPKREPGHSPQSSCETRDV
jgi:hypothetical protein